MVVSSWRGGWCVGALGTAALIVVALMVLPASGEAGAPASAAAKKCTKAIVGGKHACLRKGDKCKKAFQDDYISAGLQCKHKRLRKASINPRPLASIVLTRARSKTTALPFNCASTASRRDDVSPLTIRPCKQTTATFPKFLVCTFNITKLP